jgi:hypothetical protein
VLGRDGQLQEHRHLLCTDECYWWGAGKMLLGCCWGAGRVVVWWGAGGENGSLRTCNSGELSICCSSALGGIITIATHIHTSELGACCWSTADT